MGIFFSPNCGYVLTKKISIYLNKITIWGYFPPNNIEKILDKWGYLCIERYNNLVKGIDR